MQIIIINIFVGIIVELYDLNKISDMKIIINFFFLFHLTKEKKKEKKIN